MSGSSSIRPVLSPRNRQSRATRAPASIWRCWERTSTRRSLPGQVCSRSLIAVDPTSPQHLVTAYMDYSLLTTGYAGIRVAVSTTGGRTGHDFDPFAGRFDQGAADRPWPSTPRAMSTSASWRLRSLVRNPTLPCLTPISAPTDSSPTTASSSSRAPPGWASLSQPSPWSRTRTRRQTRAVCSLPRYGHRHRGWFAVPRRFVRGLDAVLPSRPVSRQSEFHRRQRCDDRGLPGHTWHPSRPRCRTCRAVFTTTDRRAERGPGWSPPSRSLTTATTILSTPRTSRQ